MCNGKALVLRLKWAYDARPRFGIDFQDYASNLRGLTGVAIALQRYRFCRN